MVSLIDARGGGRHSDRVACLGTNGVLYAHHDGAEATKPGVSGRWRPGNGRAVGDLEIAWS